MFPNTTGENSSAPEKAAAAGIETAMPAIEGQVPDPSSNPYARAAYVSMVKSHDDEEERLRPRKFRKLRRGLFSSATDEMACARGKGVDDAEAEGGEDDDEGEGSSSESLPSAAVEIEPPIYRFTFTSPVPAARAGCPGEVSPCDAADNQSCEGALKLVGSFLIAPQVAGSDEELFDDVDIAPASDDELASLEELMLGFDDETSHYDENNGVCVSPADGSFQYIKGENWPRLHPEGKIDLEFEEAVALFLGSDKEDEDTDEWFDAEEGSVEKASSDDTPSEGSVTTCPTPTTPSPAPDPSPSGRRVTFSDKTAQFGGNIGNVALVLRTPPPRPQLTVATGPGSPPSITITPPTPRRIGACLHGRHPRRQDTTRLFVRNADWDLRGSQERNRRAVRDRWAVVKRRRTRLEEALRPRVGEMGAWMLAEEASRRWSEWAWRGD